MKLTVLRICFTSGSLGAVGAGGGVAVAGAAGVVAAGVGVGVGAGFCAPIPTNAIKQVKIDFRIVTFDIKNAERALSCSVKSQNGSILTLGVV